MKILIMFIMLTKPVSGKVASSDDNTGSGSLKMRRKILTVNLPVAQIMKTGENTYVF